MYVSFKNSLSSSQFPKFPCAVAVLGSQLIRVSTNLNKVLSFLGSITSNAVSTLAINANTSLFSPLNGVTKFKTSSDSSGFCCSACSWTRTRSVPHSFLLGLGLALLAEASFLDPDLLCFPQLPSWTRTCSAFRSFPLGPQKCLASSFCGPPVLFPTGVFRLLRRSYCFNVATSLYIPHTHLTPVLYLQAGN